MGNPISWLGSLFGGHGADVVLQWDESTTRSALGDMNITRSEPTEGRLDGSSGELVFIPGTPGQEIDIDALVASVPAAVQAGGSPLMVEASWATVPPRLTTTDFDPLIAEAAAVINSGASLTVNDYVAALPADTAAKWFSSDFDDSGQPILVVDREQAAIDIEALLADGGVSGGGEALYSVVDGEVVINATENARICCEEAAVDILLSALAVPDRDRAVAI